MIPYQLLIDELMIKADLETYNGVFQRVNPTYEVEFILSKLKQFQFNGSIVNTDKFIIEYENFNKFKGRFRKQFEKWWIDNYREFKIKSEPDLKKYYH